VLTCSLQSGSNGNAIYVEADGVKLLFDAGISGAAAKRRLAQHGRDIRDVDAVILSHDHIDHVRCAAVYQRKFGLPVYLTRWTHLTAWGAIGPLADSRYFHSGDAVTFNGVSVHTIRTPHDAADGVCFVVEGEGKRLAILTDLGHPFAQLRDILESVDAAYLECNYDLRMLDAGPYPVHLKSRIRGPRGHLSNADAADVLRACRRRPQWIAVAHLSEENNLPELAIEAQRAAVGWTYPVHHASRHDVSDLWTV
jgi:phosphoribosyl 1,2-cyclic phosphodiesterase